MAEARLSAFKALKLRSICKELELKAQGSKVELLKRLRSYLESEEGRLRAYLRLSKPTLSLLFNDADPGYTLGLLYHPISAPTSMIDPPTALQEMSARYKAEIRCICIQGALPGLPCSLCKRIQHVRCMGENAKMQPYVCPLCQFLKMDMTWVPELPPIVNPFAASRANPVVTRKFMDRLVRIPAKMMDLMRENAGKYRVEVRCLRLDGRGYINTWPRRVKILLNDEEVLCLPDTVYHRSHRGPLDITEKLKLGDNTLYFLKYEDPEFYSIGVFLVKLTSVQDIIAQILATSRRLSYADGLQRVISTMSSGDDLNQDSTPVSAKCPISMGYIKTAVRGVDCIHTQCYDLDTFVVIFGKNALCPECGKLILSFVIDEFVTEIAKQAQEKATFTVYVHKDQSLTFLSEAQREEIDASDVEETGDSHRTWPKKEEAVDLSQEELKPDVTIDLDSSTVYVLD